MEKTTGELSLTVVTVVAIVAIAGFVSVILWPRISTWINSTFSELGVDEPTGYLEIITDEVNM